MKSKNQIKSGFELIELAKGKKIAVTGSRTLAGNREIAHRLFRYLELIQPLEIIHGGAEGPDQWASEYANAKGIKEVVFTPNYEKHGKYAPLVRNTAIASECEVLIAIWDLKSKGTADTIQKTHRHCKQIIYIV